MVTEEEISQALQSLLLQTKTDDPDPSSDPSFASLDGVVRQLQSKLGVDLSHKVDFVRTQIHHFLKSPPLKDDFALHQNPNSRPSASSSSTAFQGVSSAKQGNDDGAVAGDAAVKADEVAKESGSQPKAKRRPGGLNKLCGVSPELQAIVGQPALPRTEIVKQLWAYIKKNNLQDPKNKRRIICNDELRLVFETDCTDMFKMNKLLAKHILPLEQIKEPVRKKAKLDAEPGTQSTECDPPVIISKALKFLWC